MAKCLFHPFCKNKMEPEDPYYCCKDCSKAEWEKDCLLIDLDFGF